MRPPISPKPPGAVASARGVAGGTMLSGFSTQNRSIAGSRASSASPRFTPAAKPPFTAACSSVSAKPASGGAQVPGGVRASGVWLAASGIGLSGGGAHGSRPAAQSASRAGVPSVEALSTTTTRSRTPAAARRLSRQSSTTLPLS